MLQHSKSFETKTWVGCVACATLLLTSVSLVHARVDCSCDAAGDDHCPKDQCCKKGCQADECNHKDTNGNYEDSVGCDGYNCGSSNPPCNKFCSNSNPQLPCGGKRGPCSCLTAKDGTANARSCASPHWASADCNKQFCKKAWPSCGSQTKPGGDDSKCDCTCGGATNNSGGICPGGSVGAPTHYCGYDSYRNDPGHMTGGYSTDLSSAYGCEGQAIAKCCGGCWHQGANACQCWSFLWNIAHTCGCGSGCGCTSGNPHGGWKLTAHNCTLANCKEHCASKANELCQPENHKACSCTAGGSARCKDYPEEKWGVDPVAYRRPNCAGCDGAGSTQSCSDTNQSNCPGYNWTYETW